METEKLYKILQETTKVYRKGDKVEERKVGNAEVTEVRGYPHTSTAPIANQYKKVDMVFVDIIVDNKTAEKRKQELEKILAEYPEPDRLAGGPSYIELSPNCGLEQESGLRLMALGEVLGLWKVISGKTMKMNEERALELARGGFLMISGYNSGGKVI